MRNECGDILLRRVNEEFANLATFPGSRNWVVVFFSDRDFEITVSALALAGIFAPTRIFVSVELTTVKRKASSWVLDPGCTLSAGLEGGLVMQSWEEFREWLLFASAEVSMIVRREQKVRIQMLDG